LNSPRMGNRGSSPWSNPMVGIVRARPRVPPPNFARRHRRRQITSLGRRVLPKLGASSIYGTDGGLIEGPVDSRWNGCGWWVARNIRGLLTARIAKGSYAGAPASAAAKARAVAARPAGRNREARRRAPWRPPPFVGVRRMAAFDARPGTGHLPFLGSPFPQRSFSHSGPGNRPFAPRQ